MKRKITVLIAAAATMGIALIAGGCGGSASGAPNSSGPYGSCGQSPNTFPNILQPVLQ